MPSAPPACPERCIDNSRTGEIKGAGAYSQYTLADEDISFEVPEGTTLEKASTVPLAATTAWLAFFSKDCLAIDRESKPAVLIWGGSCTPLLPPPLSTS